MSEQEKNPLLNTKHSIHFYIQDGRAHIVKDKGSLDAEYSFTIRDGVVCVYRLLWKLEEFHWYIEPPLVLECYYDGNKVSENFSNVSEDDTIVFIKKLEDMIQVIELDGEPQDSYMEEDGFWAPRNSLRYLTRKSMKSKYN